VKLPKAFHPPLIAAFPILALYRSNMALIPSADLWVPLGIAVGAALLLWLVGALVLRDSARGALAASVVAFWVLIYGHLEREAVSEAFSDYSFAWAWSVVGIGLLVLASWRWRCLDALTRLFNAMAATLTLIVVAGICLNVVQMRRDVASIKAGTAGAQSGMAKGATPPDFFYIILDGHGGVTALRNALNYDDAGFVKGLEDRGFYVAPQSHSNYVQTELSLASSLNMQFIPQLLPNIDLDSFDRAPLDTLADRNELAARLGRAAYTYIAVTSGFPSLRFKSASLVARYEQGLSLFESTLLDDLPFYAVGGTLESQYDDRRAQLRGAFRTLEGLAVPASRPRFVFVHILAPHPPFVFEPDGSAAPKLKGPYGFWDGSHFMSFGRTHKQYRDGYVGQVQYIDKMTLRAVDAILSHARTPPVIVIQGDHGSKMGLDQESVDRTDLHECFGILNAYHVPDEVRAKLYPTITPVNSFRVILDGLFGDQLPLLPDSSAYSTWSKPYRFVDVTGRT
jgi:hypothetical protein